ncbi:MAG: ABC transporter ATP-binding protein [Legionellales bacterium]|nr:ABC transporter ATP-binding protein [Legionellales bacterium]
MTQCHSPGILLSKASLRFNQKILFENLSFELAAGKITCLLGPSGVGKTTLLRILASLPLAGRGENKLQTLPATVKKPNPDELIVHYDEQEVVCNARIRTSDQLPLRGRLAYMAQTDLLLPWLSLLDNVMLGNLLRHVPRSQSQIDHAMHILESVGLAEDAHHKPHALSSGMKQRGALARTLMEDQPVILMDEPFSALDAITRYDMQTMAAEKLQQKTVLLITHDPWEALRLGHQIFILRGQPANLSAPIIPPMMPPRDITDEALLPFQKQLLRELDLRISVT